MFWAYCAQGTLCTKGNVDKVCKWRVTPITVCRWHNEFPEFQISELCNYSNLMYVYFLCRFVCVFLFFFCPLLSKYSHITMIRQCRAYALPTTVFTLVSQPSRDNLNLSFVETLVWKWFPMKIFLFLKEYESAWSHVNISCLKFWDTLIFVCVICIYEIYTWLALDLGEKMVSYDKLIHRHFCQNNNVDNCDCALSTTHSVFTPSWKYQLLSWPNLVFALHSVSKHLIWKLF